MKKYLFYPGCSLTGNAKAYMKSLMAIREMLGMEFEEIQDWNCCGATEYGSIHRLGSFALNGRNLALAEKQATDTQTVAAPCSACYLNLSKTEHAMRVDRHLAGEVNDALEAGGLHYTPGALDIRHLLDVIFNDIGMDAIRSKVVMPLKGLRVAAYYGCLIVRPDVDHRFSNYDHPGILENLMEALGAEVVDYPMRTQCCSGHMPQIKGDVAYEMIHRLVHGAVDQSADLIVTLCPMCQLNLDAYQPGMNRQYHSNNQMPVLYFTQLMGLAFGLPAKSLGIGEEVVPAGPALAKIGQEAPAVVEQAPRKPRKDEGLPMPLMSESFTGHEEVR